jgi:hypothetical protein
MKYVLFLNLILATLVCSNLSYAQKITLQQVQSLSVGVSTKGDLLKLFGKPKQVLSILPSDETWFYNQEFKGESYQRASFNFDKKLGTLSGSLFIPSDSDEVSTEKKALAYFKNSVFVKKPVKNISKHEFVDDVNFIDDKNGIGFEVIKPSNRVASVVFDLPQKVRDPANTSKKTSQ